MKRDCWRNIVLVAALAVVIGGCASTGPAPVEDRSLNPSPRSRPAAPASRAPSGGATYRVQRGDTLYSIAFRHGVDYRELADWNGIAPPYTIYPGRELRLASPRAATRAAMRPAPAPASPSVARVAPSAPKPPAITPAPPPPSANAGTPSRVGPPNAPPPAVTPPSPPPEAAPSGDIAWRWPADGSVVGGYVAGDPMRQGIDIAGQAGAPVRAAADGTVVYSGNGLIGYGELIIVKHNPAFLSAYGHNRKRLVQEGERVKAGQTIAEMGSSGASRDELHFEIRKNGKPSNPLDYLPRR
ncbi:MAG TPA: peptidoglycan DD-metalloendopeptidase family protein [Rhodanobacteraceae bacterium]|nr:peptidoglycan DD-metalloendopeptidase family protein [Rhodanobacteraceae bacterium]